mmetsp:Transcript_14058/g.35803  ORF Transcript_14058/g.35803 Transcript_14058/m.35803 type:complete len:296 (+) Transcript_14058:41-928(+)
MTAGVAPITPSPSRVRTLKKVGSSSSFASSMDPELMSPRRIVHAKADYTVKGEDTSRTCSIELEPDVIVRFYGVFDGHGGPLAGRFCAEHLPSLIASHYAAAPGASRAERIRNACKSAYVACDELFRSASPTRGDGATATCVIVDGDEVTIANVGDSEAVLYLAGESRILSADHRVGRRTPAEHTRLMDAGAAIGRIRGRNGQPVGPERVYPGGLSVTRSIGDSDSTAAAIPDPDVSTITLPASGGMIVIASDGMRDFVSRTLTEKLAQQSRKPRSGAAWLARADARDHPVQPGD